MTSEFHMPSEHVSHSFMLPSGSLGMFAGCLGPSDRQRPLCPPCSSNWIRTTEARAWVLS
jgi:hypothetical protein